MIEMSIKKLVQYGRTTGLIEAEDEIYARNQILEVLKMSEYEEPGEITDEISLEDTLNALTDYAAEQGILENNSVVYRDLFDTRLMNCLMPRPSEVVKKFRGEYEKSPEDATAYFYKLSQDSDYIRRYRVCKDLKWITKTEYGDLDITVNLSKPEKDPKAIAAAKTMKQSGYPKCLLCMENVGYAGRINHPARNNHRIIPLTLNGESWGFQYSPYVYYNEHCIVFNGKHTPMKIDRNTFKKLFDFVTMFPHYFLGSNADLPIVGGSILTHDHFQGGRYTFAMAKAPVEKSFTVSGYEDVEAGIVKWPMSVIRIRSEKKERLVDLADKILTAWRGYTDADADIYAETDGEPHNTITPIARFRGGKFELDLVLRNNRTTEERPLGLFHPNPKLHHIKKENIGLIEVMGLAILPARLKEQGAQIAEILSGQQPNTSRREGSNLAVHADWIDALIAKYGTALRPEEANEVVKKEIGIVFSHVLENAGVFKQDAAGQQAFVRFMYSVGFKAAD